MSAAEVALKPRRITLVRGMALSSTALCSPEMARDDAEAIAAWNRRAPERNPDNG